MASREPYTQAHDEDMLEFWETKMKEGNEIARDPCGFRLWEEYIRQGHSQRTRDSLTSHFRKQVLPKLTTWSWTATRKLELVKKWGVSIDKNMQTSLERNCKAVLKLGNAGNLKSWTFMAPKQRRSGESSTAPPKRPSPPQRRIRPVIVEDEDVIITEDEEDEVVQTKRIKNEPVAIEDPTMNELDWTREIRVLKEHRRVRHSTREALGLPPITTPPHLREQQPDQSMEPALSDDSFVREEDNKANEGFVERQTEQQVLPDGQGNDIDTITDLTEISSHPASTSTFQISQQFRSKACNAAFKRLKEVQKCIKDDLLPVFRKIERQIEIGSLSQLEYLDKLAEAAEDFMLTVQAATRPLPNSLESPSKIRLIRLPHDNISPAHRAEKASSLWKSFASTTPKGLFDRVREVIEEREPLILRTSDSMEQYDQKILKLEQDLKTEVAKNLA